ncbi:hypothetical protein OSTOST_04641 [Ostertagia ostertagi]
MMSKKEFDTQSKPSTRRSSKPLTAAHLKSVLNSSPSRYRNDYRAAATARIKKHKNEHQRFCEKSASFVGIVVSMHPHLLRTLHPCLSSREEGRYILGHLAFVRDDSSADVVFASPHRVISHCPDKANTFYPGPSSRSSISHESRAQVTSAFTLLNV